MPKSSTDSVTPSERRMCICLTICSSWPSRMPSVSSSSSDVGRMPLAASASLTRLSTPWRLNWIGDMLTAMRRSPRPAAFPGRALAAGLVQDPFVDRQDQARLFGQAQERAGRQQAALRVLPAQQRLDADDLVAAQIDLRLIVQHEFVARQRTAQLGLEMRASGWRAGACRQRRNATCRRRATWPDTSPGPNSSAVRPDPFRRAAPG